MRGASQAFSQVAMPRIHHYISRLKTHTAPSPLTIMQSNGGHGAAGRAVNLLLSGPAGGLSAAHRLGGALGEDHLMTFDMGGTSTDVALLDGDIRLTQSGHIGPYPVAVPMVDMHTIGAGGGSLARVDDAGLLHVGPQSAGADPGPACYGKGGQEPTVTDANLVLGRLQPEFALGGSLALDRDAAEAAVARVAQSLGLDTVSAARGIIELANEHMSQALRVISIQKGFDPADFQLVSFGGAGGLHVCALAENLGMRRAVMPIRAGVLSAEGLVYAPRKRELIQALPGGADAARVDALAADLDRRGRRELASEGVPDSDVVTEVTLDLCYQGQSSTLGLPWDGDPEAAEAAFHRLHEHRYGHRLALPVQRVNVRVRCQAPARPPASPSFASPRPAASPQFTSPEAYLHGNYEAPRPPSLAPRQLFDEDAEVDLPPARDAAPARVTPDERFATSRGVGSPGVAADPRAGTTYPGKLHNNPQHASLRAAATADERFATSRGVASQPPKAVVATPPSSPVRPNGTVMARSPSAVEGYALY